MRILFLAHHYAPEEVSGAVLATELATDLVRRGHQVSFVTCAPNYPNGEVLTGYKNSLLVKEMLDGVHVTRIWSYISPRKTFWPRILQYGTFSASAFYGALLAGKPDLIFSYSPPLPLGVTAWLLSRIWQVPWILRVEDLFPEAAVVAGVLRNRLAVTFFNFLERFLYQKATHISLISEGFRQNLTSKSISNEKLSVEPVWADPEEIQPLPKENEFRQQHVLENCFVVLYAGNLGHNTALEDVIVAAEQLQTHNDIRFIIVGEGVKKTSLIELAQEKHLKNVIFLPYQPRHSLSEMMASADVSLVTLNKHAFHTSLPSKTFAIMASARPILAVTPPESEIARLVSQSFCGVNVPPGQPETLSKTILDLNVKHDLLEKMGRNGRIQLETNYSRKHCVGLYENLIIQVFS